MPESVQDVVVRLRLENKQLKKELENTERSMDKTKKAAFGLGDTFRLIAGSAIVGVLIKGLKSVVKQAIDAQETFGKFNVVFKSVGKEADLVAKNLAKNFGISGVKAKELLSYTGDLLTGFGFTGKAALDLSKEVNELAIDLASFTNLSGGAGGAEEASKALTKALLGERESVKSLGISILETDVKEQVLINRTKGLTFETGRQEKAYATLQIAQRQSKNAIGDFARTSGSTANQLRILNKRIEDASIVTGGKLEPALNTVLQVVNKATEGFDDFGKKTEDVDKVSGSLNILKKIIVGIIAGLRVFGETVKLNFQVIKAFANTFTEQFKGAIEIVKTLGDENLTLGEKFEKIKSIGVDTAKDIGNEWKDTAEGYKDAIVDIIGDTQELFDFQLKQNEDAKTQGVKSEKGFTEEMRKQWRDRTELAKKYADTSQDLSDAIFQIATNNIDNTVKNEREAAIKKAEIAQKKAVMDKVTGIFSTIVNTAKAIVEALPNPFLVGFTAATGAAQTAAILSTPLPEIPKFQRGGIVGGRSHDQGGTFIEAERGEAILNREATAVLGAEAINALNEGRTVAPNVQISVQSNDGREVVRVLNDYFKQFGGGRQLGLG